jgi:hypothetical protein
MWFYVDKDRQQRGPVSVDELKRLLASNEITKRTHLWQEGRANWMRLEDLAGELGIAIAAPPPTPAATAILQPLSAAQMQAPAPQAMPNPMPQPMPMPAPMPQPMAQQPMMPPQAMPPQAMPPQAMPQHQMPQQQMPPQSYQQPGAPMPPFASPAQAPYPQQGYPMPAKKSGFPMWIFGVAGALGLVGLKYGHSFIPQLADWKAKSRLSSAYDELGKARSAVDAFIAANNGCPGEKPLETELTLGSAEDWQYGATDDGNCMVRIQFAAGHEFKPLAEKTLVNVKIDGKWQCGSNANIKLLPSGCEHFE